MKGWKTLLTFLGVTIFGALQSFDFTQVTADPTTLGYITAGIGVIGIVLRMLTNTPVGKK